MSASFTSRRTVLAAAGTVPLAASLTACGESGGDDGEGGSTPGAGEEPRQEESQDDKESPEPNESGGQALAKASEVPEGGGTILKAEKVVVTQPSAGEYKAFSAVCQHQGCLVTSVSGGTINCACHGSKYALGDGSVVKGPATKGLPEVNVSVEQGSIRRA